jgi:YVTN family beta-propeller protein
MPRQDEQGAWVSDDGLWRWDGTAWQPVASEVSGSGITQQSRTIIAVGRAPSSLAHDDRYVWVANSGDSKISRIDPTTNGVQHIEVGQQPAGIAVGDGFVWVALTGEDSVLRVKAESGEVDDWGVGAVGKAPVSLCWAQTYLWVWCAGDPSLYRIDPRRDEVANKSLHVGRLSRLQFGHGSLWATSFDTDRVLRIDSTSGQVTAKIPAGPNPNGLAVTAEAVWVTASNDRAGTSPRAHRKDPVWRINPGTNQAVKFEVGGGPSDIAVDREVAWIAQGLGQSILALDSGTGKIVRSLDVGNESIAITLLAGSVWAAQPFAIGARSTDPAPGTVTRFSI